MRVHSGLSFNQIDELCTPVGQYEVVGPTGQYYGRYESYPRPDQIPLYAMVKKVNPTAMTVRIVDGRPVMGGMGTTMMPADYVVARFEAKDEDGNYVPGAQLVISGATTKGHPGATTELTYVPFFTKLADGGGNIPVNHHELYKAARSAQDAGLLGTGMYSFPFLLQLSKSGMKTASWKFPSDFKPTQEVQTVVLQREAAAPAPSGAPAPSRPGKDWWTAGTTRSDKTMWPFIAVGGAVVALLVTALFLKK